MTLGISLWRPALSNVKCHYGTWSYWSDISIICDLVNELDLITVFDFITLFREIFIRHLQRVRLANRRRLLLRAPVPVPFGTCICSNVSKEVLWSVRGSYQTIWGPLSPDCYTTICMIIIYSVTLHWSGFKLIFDHCFWSGPYDRITRSTSRSTSSIKTNSTRTFDSFTLDTSVWHEMLSTERFSSDRKITRKVD